MESVIGIFGGCRPHADTNDFVIGEAEDAPGFVNAGGTESPGFTSAVAIARHVAGIARREAGGCRRTRTFDPYQESEASRSDTMSKRRTQTGYS